MFYNITTGKATSQSIRKEAPNLAGSRCSCLSGGLDRPLDPERRGALRTPTDIVVIRYTKEVGVPRYGEKDPDVVAFEELRKKYLPNDRSRQHHRLRRLRQVGDDGRNPAPLRR